MSNIYDERYHPLLAQVPLTVSPFLSLPTATTLPYTYKSLPSTLPPSILDSNPPSDKLKFVVSSTGAASHPDEIIASCRALETHLRQMEEDAEIKLKKWEEEIRERILAEKRRLAPGWLDREEKILEPERQREEVRGLLVNESVMDLMTGLEENGGNGNGKMAGIEGDEAGEELDRAFGSMGVR